MIKGQFCTMDSHLIHSDPVLRLKGQECTLVNDQGSIMYYEKLSFFGLVTRSLRSQSNAPVLGYSRWAIMGCDQLLNAPRCNPNRVGDHNRNRSSINYGSLPTNIIILGGGITLEGNSWLRLIVWSVSDSTRRQYIFCFHTESVCWQFNIKGVVPVGAYGFYREGTL